MRNEQLRRRCVNYRKESCCSSSWWCLNIAVVGGCLLLLLPIVQSQTASPCFAQLALADGDSSNGLNQTEFVLFVENFSGGAVNVGTFVNLPLAVQTIYVKAACPSCLISDTDNLVESCCSTKSLSIYGTRPSDHASGRTTASLVRFCHSIDSAIQSATVATADSSSQPQLEVTVRASDSTSSSTPAPSAASFSFVLPTAPADFPGVELPTTGFITASPTLNLSPTKTLTPSAVSVSSNSTSSPIAPSSSPAGFTVPTVVARNATSVPSVEANTNSTALPTRPSSSPSVSIGGDSLIPSLIRKNTTLAPSFLVDGTVVPTGTLLPTASGAPTISGSQFLAPTKAGVPTQIPTLLVISDKTSSPFSLPSSDAPFAVDTTPPPTLSPAKCVIALAYSDTSRDSALDSDPEYIRFLNRLNYPSTSFSSLPQVLQSNFFKLAGSSTTIDITGSAPGASPSQSELANLENVCLQTSLAISAARSGATESPASSPSSVSPGTSQPSSSTLVPTTNAPSPSTVVTPVPAPTPFVPTGGTVPTIPIGQCNTAMAFSDLNRDDYLSQDEYIRFVNRLSSNAFSGATFNSLPSALVNNFNKLAGTNGEIYIYGARPGESADSTQSAFLSQVCNDTQQAIAQSQGGGSPSPSSSPPQTSSPLSSPTATPASPSLPPNSPTENGTQPTVSIAPTPVPNGPVPIISAFSISNKAGLTAVNLGSGLNRQGLGAAYKLLVENVVANLSSSGSRRQLRIWSRHLTVIFQNDSAAVDRIRDAACPSTAANGSLCQDVIAHYIIIVANEKNVPAIQQEYTNATQAAIAAGHLETALKKADAQSALVVVGAIPIPIDALSPTASPSSPPTGTSGGSSADGGGSNTGAIVGGVLAGLVGLFVIGWYTRRRSKGSTRRPSKDEQFASAPKFDDIVNSQKPADYSENDHDFPDLEESPVVKKESFDQDDDAPTKTQEQPPDKANPSMFGGLFRKKSSKDVTSNKDGSQPENDEGDDHDGEVVKEDPSNLADNRRTGFGLFGQKSIRKSNDETDDPFGKGRDDEMDPSENDEPEVDTKKGAFNVFGIGGNARKRHSDPGVLEASQSGGFGDQSVDFSVYSFDEPTVTQEQNQQQALQRHSAPPTFKDATSSSGWSTGDDSPSSQDSFFESEEWAQAQGQISPAAPSQAGGDKTPKIGSKGFPNGEGQEASEVDFDDEDSEDEEDDDEEDEEGVEDEEDTDSYTGDGDSTYHSNGIKDEGTFDGTLHSASDFDKQIQDALERERRAREQAGGEIMNEDLIRRSSELDQMVEMEDWDGVVKAANHFPSNHERFSEEDESDDDSDEDSDDDDEYEEEVEVELDHDDEEDSDDEEEEEEEEEFDEEEDDVVGGSDYENSDESGEESYVSEEGSGADDSGSGDPDEAQRRAEYRAEVEALVRMVVPDEINNVDVMMTQFRGREAELVATLRTMQERSVSQRARAAVHRSKGGGGNGARSDTSSFTSSPAGASRSSTTNRTRTSGHRRTHGAFDGEEESEVTPNGW